MPREATLNI